MTETIIGGIVLSIALILLLVMFIVAVKADKHNREKIWEYRNRQLEILNNIDIRLERIAIAEYVKKERKTIYEMQSRHKN